MPKEGIIRQPRPGETMDRMSDPLGGQASEANLIMRPPKITPNTMHILEATEYAQCQGKFMEFHHAAYKAYWEDGLDLGDLAVIEGLAQQVSLNSTELLDGLESKLYTPAVMEQYQQALGHGIRGIPTFVVGNLLFTGAHPYEIFQSAMNKVLEAPATQ